MMSRSSGDGYRSATTRSPEETTNPLLKFLSYFWGPIPWMIEVAVVLSAVVGHWADFGIILTLLWPTRSSASGRNIRRACHRRAEGDARADSPGKTGRLWSTVPARELVPGTSSGCGLGDIVPADATLRDGDPLRSINRR